MSKASKLIAEQPESPLQTRKVDHFELHLLTFQSIIFLYSHFVSGCNLTFSADLPKMTETKTAYKSLTDMKPKLNFLFYVLFNAG